jgi:hypothetical protein
LKEKDYNKFRDSYINRRQVVHLYKSYTEGLTTYCLFTCEGKGSNDYDQKCKNNRLTFRHFLVLFDIISMIVNDIVRLKLQQFTDRIRE